MSSRIYDIYMPGELSGWREMQKVDKIEKKLSVSILLSGVYMLGQASSYFVESIEKCLLVVKVTKACKVYALLWVNMPSPNGFFRLFLAKLRSTLYIRISYTQLKSRQLDMGAIMTW